MHESISKDGMGDYRLCLYGGLEPTAGYPVFGLYCEGSGSAELFTEAQPLSSITNALAIPMQRRILQISSTVGETP